MAKVFYKANVHVITNLSLDIFDFQKLTMIKAINLIANVNFHGVHRTDPNSNPLIIRIRSQSICPVAHKHDNAKHDGTNITKPCTKRNQKLLRMIVVIDFFMFPSCKMIRMSL